MSVSMHTRAQKDLAEAPSVDFDLVTPGPGQSLAVRPRRQWYQARPEDLSPLTSEQMETLRALDRFGPAGATNDTLAKTLGRSREEVREVLGGQLMRKGIVRSKGALFFVDKVGRVHLSGTLDSVRED